MVENLVTLSLLMGPDWWAYTYFLQESEENSPNNLEKKKITDDKNTVFFLLHVQLYAGSIRKFYIYTYILI